MTTVTFSDTADTMDDTTRTAQALLQAYRSGTPVAAADFPLPDAAAAYAVQATLARALGCDDGATAMFWKSGGPRRDAVLTHAPLPPARIWTSPAQSGTARLRLRYIEAEIALRLGQDVDATRAAGLDLAAAEALVDAMCVSIEIVDSRWTEGLQAPALAKLADLQSHGALVLGAWQPFASRDWARQTCALTIGSAPPQHFTGTHPLADPVFVLPAWLVHATRGGAVLRAGTVVTTGSWCGMPQAQAGDHVEVCFDGVGSASVRV